MSNENESGDTMVASWSQPVCEDCWFDLNPTRPPVRMTNATRERCAHCGEQTVSGIYVHVDPATVQFPARRHR